MNFIIEDAYADPKQSEKGYHEFKRLQLHKIDISDPNVLTLLILLILCISLYLRVLKVLSWQSSNPTPLFLVDLLNFF